MYSLTEYFDAVGPVKEIMPQSELQDLIRYMHFADDRDDERGVWESFYMDKKEVPKDGAAQHQKKHAQLEDAYNARWQEIVNFRRWVTADESRLTGWYHSVMTIGPELKPIHTGLTLHSLCVTKVP